MGKSMEENIGIKLCKFMKTQLEKQYAGLKGKIEFAFICGENEKELRKEIDEISSVHEGIKKIPEYSLKQIRDSRLGRGRLIYACWIFQSQASAEMQRAWKYLGKVLVEALSDKFVDLLYLEETEKEITDVRTGVTGNLVKHFVGELLDEKWLMDCYANKVLEKCGFPERKILLYMSAQLYERRPVKARIYFSDRSLKTMVHDMGKESEKKPVSFIRLETEDADKGLEMLEYKINLDNLRIIRKLMEMPGEEYGLLAVGKNGEYKLDGIVRNALMEEKSYIQFDGYMSWYAVFRNSKVLEYQNGNYRVPMINIDKDKDGWQEELGGLEKIEITCNLEAIKKAIKVLAENNEHGTSIVFMSNELLKHEVERLWGFKRAYRVDRFFFADSAEAVKGITGMDGALMADFDGYCYAVGAILDGEMIGIGNPGRGARYNSVANYVHWVLRKWKEERKEGDEPGFCFAAVLSEDKMVNLEMPGDEEIGYQNCIR